MRINKISATIALMIGAPCAIPSANADKELQKQIDANERTYLSECAKLDSMLWVITEFRGTLQFDCNADKVWLFNQNAINDRYANSMPDSQFRKISTSITTARTGGDTSSDQRITRMKEMNPKDDTPTLEALRGYGNKGQFSND